MTDASLTQHRFVPDKDDFRLLDERHKTTKMSKIPLDSSSPVHCHPYSINMCKM